MDAKIRVRDATADDAGPIAEAHVRAWQVAYEGIVDQGYLDALDIDERTEHWRTNLTSAQTREGLTSPSNYVAEVNGRVVGFACVGRWREAIDDARLGELWAMYVHPDEWGTGAGYRLMKRSVEHFRTENVQRSYLWVLEENTQARRFYERQGWRRDDVTLEDSIAGASITERRYSLDLDSLEP